MSSFCLGLAGRASAPAEPDSACCMELPAGAGDAVRNPAAATATAAALVSFPGGLGELELALEEELALLAAGERPSDPGDHPQAEPESQAEGHGPPPPPPTQDPELLVVIQQKEKDLVLAARLGKALLERNQDMSRQYEQMHKELTDKLEHLEQEKHELRRRFENWEGEWEGRVSELETDVKQLQDELERQWVHLREADREKTRAVQELSEQNQRLLDQLSRDLHSAMSSEEGKLFVGGLNFNTDEQALEDHFSTFGPISEVVVVKDRETQRSRGFGFITFTNPEHASDAMRAMNGESLDGRQIRVDHAGKSARGTRGGAFGAHGRGRSYSRGGGDQGYGSGRYDSRPGGYGYGYGRSRDYSGSQGGYDRYSGGNYRDNYDN